MSELKVEVVKIDEIKVHPNADALDLAIVKGWQTVVRKGEFKSGELAVYFPLDSVLPERLSEAIGVTKYLHSGRVCAAKLRGEPSYGLLWNKQQCEDYIYPPPFDTRNFGEDMDLTEGLGVTKWEPPPDLNDGETEKPHSNFFCYTDIQNMRNFPNIIQEGEDVRMTEKVHGANHRIGLIDNTLMVGSHNLRKRENDKSKWWEPVRMFPAVKDLLQHLRKENSDSDVTIFGELYGVQDLKYGLKNGGLGYRCYDISINGKYLNYFEFSMITSEYRIPVVPVLYRGPFSLDIVKSFEGKSRIEGADNIIEGVVVTPVIERYDAKIGRVVLKYVYDSYLCRKNGTEFH
jgi:RNA ligase (TIGR02306 family)